MIQNCELNTITTSSQETPSPWSTSTGSHLGRRERTRAGSSPPAGPARPERQQNPRRSWRWTWADREECCDAVCHQTHFSTLLHKHTSWHLFANRLLCPVCVQWGWHWSYGTSEWHAHANTRYAETNTNTDHNHQTQSEPLQVPTVHNFYRYELEMALFPNT